MIINKVFLIFASFFVATKAQCPTWWWPMSAATSSVNFFSEVLRGNNIIAMPNVAADTLTTFSKPDRMSAGKQYKSLSVTAAQFIVLPADTYFCNGAFTITLFINQVAAAAGNIADFIDVAGSNIVTYSIASTSTFTLKIGTTTVTSGTTTTLTNNAWFFVAVSYGGSGSIPNFFATTVATVTTPSAVAGGAAAPTAPTCTIMTAAQIGSTIANPPTTPITAASFNDFKIYNSALSTAQVQARYSAEVGKLLKQIINLKILAVKIIFLFSYKSFYVFIILNKSTIFLYCYSCYNS
jgi:hypothetical protein